jgi:hypothetical protein
LFWKTGIRLQAGKVFRCGFAASQLSGMYEISLEGIRDGKKPVRASSVIFVKQPDTE